MYTITFEPRWEIWRDHARGAVLAGWAPNEVLWSPDEPDSQTLLPLGPPTDDAAGEKEAQRFGRAAGPTTEGERLHVPADFVRLARLVAHHRSDDRWDLLYNLLWRLQNGEHSLIEDMLDPQVFRFRRMAAAVRDDLKETRSRLHFWSPAAVRSRRRPATAATVADDRLPDMVSWCEPRHRLLPLLADDFAERYPERTFALLSPDACAFWDTRSLEFGPGMDRKTSQSPADLGAVWADRHREAA
jgi:DNA polymerase